MTILGENLIFREFAMVLNGEYGWKGDTEKGRSTALFRRYR